MAKFKFYVYSTLTAPVRYCAGTPGEPGMINPEPGIVINGGTGVINKNLITPTGAVITEVTADQLEQLRQDRVFQAHEKNGFLKVSDHKEDGEKVAGQDMEGRDASAPLTPEDFKEGEAPKVGDAKLTADDAPKSGRKA